MDTRDIYKLVRELSEEKDDVVNLYDSMDIELSEDFVIETGVVGFTEDGVIIHLDEDAMEMLDLNGILLESFDEEPVNDSMTIEEFMQEVMDTADPYEMVYNAISGDYGEEVRKEIQDYYDDVVIDSEGRLHPDDDVEDIIAYVVDMIEKDQGVSEGAYSDHQDSKYDDDSTDPSVTPRDKERAAARRRAEDDGWDPYYDERDQIDELGVIKRLLGGKPKPKVTATHKTPAELWKQHTEPKKSTSEVPVDPNTGKTLYQKVKDLAEAEYQGRKVTLNKPMAGDVKKSKVYVKKPNGKVVKVNFGDKNMKIKKSNPNRRKSFRARHNCDNPGPKWKARYWSCRAW
jgi:hypothetical protein